jgi:O-antigen ligase
MVSARLQSLSPATRGRLDRLEFFFLAAAVFFSPINYLRIQTFYFTLSDALSCICLCVMLFNRSINVRPMGAATPYWIVGLIMLVGGLVISSTIGGDGARGLVFVGQYIFAYILLMFMIGDRPEEEVIKLVKVFIISIFVMCVHGIYVIDYVGEKNTAFVSGSGRLGGFVERENQFAALTSLSIPFLFWYSSKRKLNPIITLFVLLVILYANTLTASNTGVGSAFLVIMIFFVATITWSRLILGAVSVGLIVLAAGTWGHEFLPDVFQRRVLGAVESGDVTQAGTFDHRVELIQEAIGMTRQTTFLGVGADQYIAHGSLGQQVHNTYLLLWVEGGFISTLGIVVMVCVGLYAAMAAARVKGGWISAVCTFSVIAVFAIMMNALTHVYGRFYSVPILLSISISFSCVRAANERALSVIWNNYRARTQFNRLA